MSVWESQWFLQKISLLSWKKYWEFHLYQKCWIFFVCSWCSECHSWLSVRVTLLLAHIQSLSCCLDLFVISSERSCAAAYLLSSASWEQHIIWSSCWIVMLFQNNVETQLNYKKIQNQIHEIWQNENHVILLLFLNIIKIYDWMIHDRMMHVLQIKRISKQLMK